MLTSQEILVSLKKLLDRFSIVVFSLGGKMSIHLFGSFSLLFFFLFQSFCLLRFWGSELQARPLLLPRLALRKIPSL